MKYWYLSFNQSFASTFVLYPFCTHTGSVSTPDMHPLPSLLFNHIHIHTAYITKIHPHKVYNTTQYIHLHLAYKVTHTLTPSVHHNTYTYTMYNTMNTHVIIQQLHNTPYTQHKMYEMHKYHMYNSTTCPTCTQYHLYTTPHVHSTTCITCTQHHMYMRSLAQCVHDSLYTQHRLHNMCTSPRAHNTTCATCT